MTTRVITVVVHMHSVSVQGSQPRHPEGLARSMARQVLQAVLKGRSALNSVQVVEVYVGFPAAKVQQRSSRQDPDLPPVEGGCHLRLDARKAHGLNAACNHSSKAARPPAGQVRMTQLCNRRLRELG